VPIYDTGCEEVLVKQDKRYPSILMFGGPGTGKGTQGVVIGQLPNLVHLAMGDIFRGLDKASEIGQEFASYATQGKLVPDELTVRVFQQHLDAMAERGDIVPGYHTLVLDGIPRTANQVELLAQTVDVKRVVHLMMADRDALVARLTARATKSNRPDDADRDVILNRLEVYERETKPVLDSFAKKLISRVNADQPPLCVLRDVSDAISGVVSAAI
jgi:adenylate kinase